MPARNARGQFIRRSRSTALARRAPAAPRRRRRASAAMTRVRRVAARPGVKPLALAAGAAAVAYAAANVPAVQKFAAKIPGSATFGPAAMIGLSALAIDKFVKPHRYLKAVGYAGVVLAAARFGQQGASFKWVGDDEIAALELGDDDGAEDAE